MNARFGRYEITRELGRGGMATVYEANDPQFGRKVALKVLPREFLHDTQFRARFDREARTIAALEHPSIVPVYDFGDEAGQPYFVMRLMAGGSLVERIARGPMSLNEVARIFEQIAPAIDHAHTRGVIHRDLKPGNILFDGNGNAYVADFGIAKITSSDRTDLTHGVIGTATYMSPEQAKGEPLDGRSDLYSLGAILFEMLTGHQPYQAETATGVMMKHVLEPVPQIRLARADLPATTQQIFERGMAKLRDARYSTAAAIARDLEVLRDTGSLPVESSLSATVVMPVIDYAPPPDSDKTRFLPGTPPVGPQPPPSQPVVQPPGGRQMPQPNPAPQQKKSMSGLKVAVIGLAGSGCLCAAVTAGFMAIGWNASSGAATPTAPAVAAATPAVARSATPQAPQNTPTSATARPVSPATPTPGPAIPTLGDANATLSAVSTQASSNVSTARATSAAQVMQAATSMASLGARMPAPSATALAGIWATNVAQFGNAPLPVATPTPATVATAAAGLGDDSAVLDINRMASLREVASVVKPGLVRQVGFLSGGEQFWAVSGNTANAVSDENQLNIWDHDSTDESAETYKKITGIPWDARISLDEETVLIAHKPGVREYGLQDGGKLRREWVKFGYDTIRVATTIDEETIIAGGIEADFKALVKVIDVASGNQRYAVDNGFNIADLAVRQDGTRFATSNSKGEVMMWDLKTGRKLWTYSLKTNGAAVPIAFNLDGTLLAAGACNTTSSCAATSDSTVVLLNTADGTVAGSLTLAGETVQALAFSPLGDGIVIGSRARLSIFSTDDLTAQNNRQRTARAIIPFNDATSIAFSENLDRMIVGGSDMLRMYVAK